MFNVTSHILDYLKEKVIMVTYSDGGDIQALLCKIRYLIKGVAKEKLCLALYSSLNLITWEASIALDKVGKSNYLHLFIN